MQNPDCLLIKDTLISKYFLGSVHVKELVKHTSGKSHFTDNRIAFTT